MKKGQTWISVVLYIALGTIVLTIVLAASMPVINKLRDKNVISETKDVFHQLDNTIRTVINEGPGSQRIRTIQINKGQFEIDESKEIIHWEMETKYLESSPGVIIQEGNIEIYSYEDMFVVGKYWTSLNLTYLDVIDLDFGGASGILSGRFNLLIRNDGVVSDKTVITIEEKD